jgi:hypothetical protein
MTENQKKKLHPIVEKALNMAYVGVEPIQFDDYAIEQLEDMLKEYYGKQGLPDAILELIRLSVVLDEKGCKSAAMKILLVATSAADELEKLKNEKIHKSLKISKPDSIETQK